MSDLNCLMEDCLERMKVSKVFSKDWKIAEDRFLRYLVQKSSKFSLGELEEYNRRYDKIGESM